jgi:hypothetical protein
LIVFDVDSGRGVAFLEGLGHRVILAEAG